MFKMMGLFIAIFQGVLPFSIAHATKFQAIQLPQGALDSRRNLPIRPGLEGKHPKKIVEIKKTESTILGDSQLEKTNLDELIKSANSYSQLLKLASVNGNHDKMLLGRANIYFTIGKRLLLFGEKSGSSKSDVTEKKWESYFKLAEADLSDFLSGETKKLEHRARAHLLSGIIALFRGDDQKAIGTLQIALRLEEQSSRSQQLIAWISVNIAELLFDQKKFSEALTYYQQSLASLKSDLSHLALYKAAWCFINLQKNSEAERIFLQLLDAGPEKGLLKDVIRDLAFFYGAQASQDAAVQLSRSKIKLPGVKVQFLEAVIDNLMAQGISLQDSRVFAELVSVETDSEKKAEATLKMFTSARESLASRRYFKAFLETKSSISLAKVRAFSQFHLKIAPSLEIEMQKLINVTVEAFSGRVQVADTIGKPELGEQLKSEFSFYKSLFPHSDKLAQIYELWLDVCQELSDRDCQYQVSREVLGSKKMGMLHDRARLEQLVALEALAGREPQEYADRYFTSLKEFFERKTSSKDWSQAGRNLADIYVKNKQYPLAVQVLEKILEKEPTEEHFYRLQWCRFTSARYVEVVEDTRNASFIKTSLATRGSAGSEGKILDLVREASLKLATAARDAEDFELYQNYIAQFLKLTESPEKRLIAHKDLISFLLSRGEVKGAVDYYLDNSKGQFGQTFIDSLVHQALKAGLFSALLKFPSKDISKYHAALVALGSGRPVSLGQLNSLSEVNKSYLLSLIVISKPLEFINKFSRVMMATPRVELTRDERIMHLTALRLLKGEWDFVLKATDVDRLGDIVPVTMKAYPKTDAEIRLSKIQFPNVVTKLVPQIRASRERIPAALKVRPLFIQLKIVRSQREVEDQMATSILNGSIPKGLTPEQMKEYAEGLEEAASEFLEQGKQFKSLENSIETQLKRDLENGFGEEFPDVSAERWSWPKKIEGHPRFMELLKGDNIAGALIVLDLLHSDKDIPTDEYFDARTGALLSMRVMKQYVFEELRATGSLHVMSKWKKGKK